MHVSILHKKKHNVGICKAQPPALLPGLFRRPEPKPELWFAIRLKFHHAHLDLFAFACCTNSPTPHDGTQGSSQIQCGEGCVQQATGNEHWHLPASQESLCSSPSKILPSPRPTPYLSELGAPRDLELAKAVNTNWDMLGRNWLARTGLSYEKELEQAARHQAYCTGKGGLYGKTIVTS